MIKLNNVLNEIKVNKPVSEKDLLKRMLKYNYIDFFYSYESFEDWKDSEFDEDDEYTKKDELSLAKVFFEWLENGSIYIIVVEDSDDMEFHVFPKVYKKAVSSGMGYNNVIIILHNF
jgi:hypothetical protein